MSRFVTRVRQHPTTEKKPLVLQYLREGKGPREIARLTGVTAASVSRWDKQRKAEEEAARAAVARGTLALRALGDAPAAFDVALLDEALAHSTVGAVKFVGACTRILEDEAASTLEKIAAGRANIDAMKALAQVRRDAIEDGEKRGGDADDDAPARGVETPMGVLWLDDDSGSDDDTNTTSAPPGAAATNAG